jgi:predicted Zn finger-like uncharacterized protein
MLYTRCPNCKTTFRITEEALRKAHGQVRCGRCVQIFNAYTELREQPPPGADDKERAGADEARASAAGAASAAERPATDRPVSAPALETPPDERSDSTPATPDAAAAADDGPGPLLLALDDARPAWSPDEPQVGAHRPILWRVGVGVALIALAGQVVHHFRNDIARTAVVGPLLQRTYAMLGLTIVPRWDVERYEIVDWVATGTSAGSGADSLSITARIRNAAPRTQPYPLLRLDLKNRWEETVASRVFTPDEYVDQRGDRDEMMAPNSTASARLEIVDPGPDASGFELDVCVTAGFDTLRCAADALFK